MQVDLGLAVVVDCIIMNHLKTVLITGFALYVLWTVAKPRWQFKSIVKQSVVGFVSGIPDAPRRELESFFLNDVKPK